MPSLADTFRSQESRVIRVIVAVDLTNSTNMKEDQPEALWLTTYGWFFDMLGETVEKHNGHVVKYLGDGAMAVFSEDHAAEAINWAIEVQETIADAQAHKRVVCDCSTGIAYGEVVEFETPDGARDYIGTVVDKAFRLCSAANAKAIFVDTDTADAAAMNKVRSRVGLSTAPKRKVAEYQGPEESVTAKGFSRPIPYHEILWATTRYGVSPPFVTDLSSKPPKPFQPRPSTVPPVAAVAATEAGWVRGRVKVVSDRFGFICNALGEEFWFNSDHLFRRALPVKQGDEVWYIPGDAFPGGRHRRAIDVIALGAVLDGVVERVRPEGYGFAMCLTDRGEARQIFIGLGDASAWSSGAGIEFKVGENKKGIAGFDARPKTQ